MRKEHLEMGMRVQSNVPVMAYNDEGRIPARSIGELTGIDCPYVTKRGTFCCVTFAKDGKTIRGAYKRSEITIAQV